jgi:2-amino-4-hydroxy-6-hydroxymethyldihydropteridine diphosphokinase
MTQTWVGIGGNVEPERRLPQAAQLLRHHFPGTRFSRCYRNAAFGFAGADFYNAAACFDTTLAVPELVATLHAIEEQCGRGRADPKWAPRVMDIDLLAYGEITGTFVGATLPRPDLLRRAYMLGPMAELAPQWRHPLVNRTLAQLWRELEPRTPPLTDTGINLNAA